MPTFPRPPYLDPGGGHTMRSFNLKGFPPVGSGRAKGTPGLFNAAKMIYPLTACGLCPQVPGEFSHNPGASERKTQKQMSRSDYG